MKMMKPATLLLNLSIIFILSLTASSQISEFRFKCNSTSTCESLIDYAPPNFTTISRIQILFGIKNLGNLLGANSLPLNTPPTQPISAKQKIKILFPCICINGTGISNKLIYKVKKGDGLDYIARDIFAALVTYQQIAAVNNITNVDQIEVGDALWIPLPCSCNPVGGFKVVHYRYVVEKGTSLEEIAELYGTTEDTLMMVNGISNIPRTLQTGTVLDVPLRACSSEIRNTSWDYPLLVSNGTYTLTANTCVQCKCESSNNWTLHCEPSPTDQVKLQNWHRCPSMQCQGSEESTNNLSLGNKSSSQSSCKTCSYAGYINQTIYTTVVNASSCGAVGGPQTPNGLNPSNNISKIRLQGSRCWWHVITLSSSLLLSGLLM